MDGIIKVEPQVLRSTASEFGNTKGRLQSVIESINSEVGALNGAWESEAAMAYQNAYKGLADDIERMFRMIDEHVKDLNDMATTFETAEKAILASNQGLPMDAIE